MLRSIYPDAKFTCIDDAYMNGYCFSPTSPLIPHICTHGDTKRSE